MLTKLDKDVARALQLVRENKVLAGFLQAEAGATQRQLVDLRDVVALHRAQGKAEFLLELLDLVENSPKLAAKIGA